MIMDMPYTTNLKVPHLRMQAAQLVLRQGWSTRQVARYTGYDQSTIVRWVERARRSNQLIIPTKSSRPHHHPHALAPAVVSRILLLRAERRQCAEILHYRLQQEGVVVSLSSVKRVLQRHHQSRFSKWKKWHRSMVRPAAKNAGDLVEIDTIHDRAPWERLYIYTLIDVWSRWAVAWPVLHIGAEPSVRFLRRSRTGLPFSIRTIQSDHGSEFSKHFTKGCTAAGITHRHIHVRSPNENGHLERFNRTIQEECLRRVPRSLRQWQREIPEYLRYYNTERPHMGINMQTPPGSDAKVLTRKRSPEAMLRGSFFHKFNYTRSVLDYYGVGTSVGGCD
jgi:transposase InsO family protein